MSSRTLARLASLSVTLVAVTAFALPASAATVFDGGVTLDPTPGTANTVKTLPPAPATSPAPASSNGGSNVTTNPGAGSNVTTNPGTGSSGNNSGTFLVNPLKGITDLPSLLDAIINAIVDIGTIVLILALIWVGFSFVKAQGNPKEIESAKSALLWTIIGGAILLGAKALSEVIQSTVSNL